MKIKAGIIGGAGYTGGELIRILLQHPQAEIAFVHSRSNAGNPLYKVHKDLLGETDLLFNDEIHNDIDVLFLCGGHGEAKTFLSQHEVAAPVKIIDLSQDFRLSEAATHDGRAFVYGLPELSGDRIKTANNIANPGCFATAIQLALLPLAHANLLNDVYVTGITGSTGAGQSLSETSHFSWRTNNIQAYKTLQHQHIAEITQSLLQLSSSKPAIHFVPWRGDFARGIYVSAMFDCKLPLAEVNHLFKSYYQDAAFTYVSETMIDMKQVVNTNKCLIYIEQQGDKTVVHATIDNLLKGASGQAVQNMNLLFGLPEKTGLQFKPGAF